MYLRELDPFLRFAAQVRPVLTGQPVRATDCRIFYTEEGSGRILMEQNTFPLKKGSLFYCPGGSVYTLEAAEAPGLVCLNFDLDRSHEADTLPFPVCSEAAMWDKMPVYRQTVRDHGLLNGPFLLEDGFSFRGALQELILAHKNTPPLGPLLAGSLLKTLLLKLHQPEHRQLPARLERVQTYIREHFREDISNETLGQLVGYHPYYLNRSYQAHTGMHLHQYLIRVRMEQAAYLILNTDLPLTTVAEEVGIRSYPHFSASFKASFGCSPQQYRRRTGI